MLVIFFINYNKTTVRSASDMSVSNLECVHALALYHPSTLPCLPLFSALSSCTFPFPPTICQYLPHSFSFLDSLPVLKCSWQNQWICQHLHCAFCVFSVQCQPGCSEQLRTRISVRISLLCFPPHAWTSAW